MVSVSSQLVHQILTSCIEPPMQKIIPRWSGWYSYQWGGKHGQVEPNLPRNRLKLDRRSLAKRLLYRSWAETPKTLHFHRLVYNWENWILLISMCWKANRKELFPFTINLKFPEGNVLTNAWNICSGSGNSGNPCVVLYDWRSTWTRPRRESGDFYQVTRTDWLMANVIHGNPKYWVLHVHCAPFSDYRSF